MARGFARSISKIPNDFQSKIRRWFKIDIRAENGRFPGDFEGQTSTILTEKTSLFPQLCDTRVIEKAFFGNDNQFRG